MATLTSSNIAAYVGTILDRAISVGDAKATEAKAAADTAMMAALGYSTLVSPTVSTDISVVEPAVYIPTAASGVDTALYNSTYDKIQHDLTTQFANFFTQFFPLNPTLMAQVEAWLYNAIVNGGSGINASVEDQIWQRDRDRLNAAASAAADEAVAQWAAKGFPLPPGAAVAAVTQIQRDRDIKIGESSRDRAIKSWEMEYENVKFAIQQAIDLRVKAVQAAADYIRALALAPQMATQMATAALGAQAQLISAASQYYNARIKVAEMKLEKDKTNATMYLTAGEKTFDGFNARIQNQTNAAVAVAQSLGTQAASALNAVNASAQALTKA